ncbi:MAG: ATP-binding protein [Bryobacteraceae bacterium]
MNIDIYTDDLERAPDTEMYAAVVAFTGISAPFAERIQEGYQLDFKSVWNDSALQTVAAFANTFGGLLLVGVIEKDGRADQIPGIALNGQELKTRIASSIASNISPTPAYEIREIVFPHNTDRHICIIRVQKRKILYFLTKKGCKSPVYIRNEDESIPADAAQLQLLLATRLGPDAHSTDGVFAPLQKLPMELYVTEVNQNAPPPRQRAENFLQLSLMPEESLGIHLDLALEEKTRSIICATYPDLSSRADDPSSNLGASFTEDRSGNSYQLTYSQEYGDYQMRWIVIDNGAIYFVSQIRCYTANEGKIAKAEWSLADVMTHLDCTIEAAHALWKYLGFPGEGRLNSELRVGQLGLLTRSQPEEVCASAFYEQNGPGRRARPLSKDALRGPATSRPRAYAGIDLTFAMRLERRSEAIAVVTNQLLRNLGYAVSLDALRAL